MEVVAKLNHLRMAPRKVRLVADVIRGKDALKARANLSFLPRRAAKPFLGLLDSALANAKNNFQLDEKTLYLAKVLVDEGPKLKRWRPRARGRAFPIQKKTSHLTIVLQEQEREGLSKKRSAAGKRREKTEVVSLVEKAKPKPKAMPKTEKQKIKPELAITKPKSASGFKKIFRRKAI
jgi:large subunit ribosomal protein L22